VRYIPIVNFTASQEIATDVLVARSWTVNDSGGTLVNPGAVTRLDVSGASSQCVDIRISAGVATGLTAGTRVLDTHPILYESDANKLGTGAPGGFNAVLDLTGPGQHPLVLDPNQGFIVRNLILGGAGGSVRVAITVEWSEAPSY
jgi:hypothetical protein